MRSGEASVSSAQEIGNRCEAQHQHLLMAIKQAARILSAPTEAEMLNAVAVLRLAREEANLIDALNPENYRYKRNVTTYLASFGNESEDLETVEAFQKVLAPGYPEEKEESELATLFRQPHMIMPAVYKSRRRFSLDRDRKVFNFAKPLQLIFKIHLLQFACLRDPGFPLTWLEEQYQTLMEEVNSWVQILTMRDEEQIKQALYVAPAMLVPFSAAVPAAAPGEVYDFVEDDTYNLMDPYGYVAPSLIPWLFYWDSVSLVLHRSINANYANDPRKNPLQMEHAQYYSWRERILYFIFGGDVRKYLKDNGRWLHDGIEVFNNVVAGHYHRGFGWQSTFSVAWMAGNLFAMLFNDVPLALLKGLSSLLPRLGRGLLNKVTTPASFSRRGIDFLLSGVELILTTALYLGLRIPLFLAMLPLRFGLGAVTVFIFPTAMAFARWVWRPLFSSENKKQNLPALYFKLRSNLQQELGLNPGYKNAFIAGSSVTVLALESEYKKLQANHAQGTTSFAGLSETLRQQKAFILCLQKEEEESLPVIRVMLAPKEDANFAQGLNRLIQHKALAELTLDWQFYRCQGRPYPQECHQMTVALANRNQPLKKFCLIGAELNAAALRQITDALISNSILQPEVVSFNLTVLTAETLKILLNLVTEKKCIKNIPCLPEETHGLQADAAMVFFRLNLKLKENRERNHSAAPCVLALVESKDEEKRQNSPLIQGSFLNAKAQPLILSQPASNLQGPAESEWLGSPASESILEHRSRSLFDF